MPAPTTYPPHDQRHQRDLGDSLRLRWSTAADTEQLVDLYARVFRERPEDPPNDLVPFWVRDMLSGRHPLIAPEDFALVEDTRTATIVAATCLLRATWDYAGVALPAGRPEIVATDAEYRHRGLVRAIFEMIHARSDTRGDLAQGITGIPYFYRQFGYEYAMDLETWRTTYFSAIPALKPDAREPYRLRPATQDDLPLIQTLYDRERAGTLVSSRIDEADWRWLLDGIHPLAGEYWDVRIIEATGEANDTNGDASEARPVGYVWTTRLRRDAGKAVGVLGLASLPKTPLLAVVPSMLRELRAQAPSMRARKSDAPPADQIRWYLGVEHPVYEVLGDLAQTSQAGAPYAWYVRVPDLPALIRRIAPVLEQRLAASQVTSGYSGELTLDFHRSGLRLVFERGRLITVEDWRKPVWGSAGAGFPPLVFLQLLFGHRGLDELRAIYPDVEAENEAGAVLRVLFPRQRSLLRYLD